MATKHNIRQRRQERIKSLLDQATPTSQSANAPSFDTTTRIDDDARTMNDPELLWKRQQQLWDRRYREEHSDKHWGGFWSPVHFRNKLIVSSLLLALLWGIFQLEQPWASGVKRAIEHALTEEFDFNALEQWYSGHFDGFPSFIPAFDFNTPSEKVSSSSLRALHVPIQGHIDTPFSPEHPGVKLITAMHERVRSVADGRVLFVGETAQTGLTVIIQHADGLRTIVGYLDSTLLEINDWIKGGETVGVVSPIEKHGVLYFGMKKEHEFLNPAEVISFQ